MTATVLVSMRSSLAPPHDEARDAVSHELTRYLGDLGVLPVPLPNVLADPVAFAEALGVAGLVLSGGGTVQPVDATLPDPTEAARDRTERAVLRWAVRRGVPVFGICRGLQALNVFLGGTLVPDIGAVGGIGHVGTTHEVTLTDSDLQRRLARSACRANSFHAQGVTADTLAEGLSILAMAGPSVEAVRHLRHPWWAVMWHPERADAPSSLDHELFGAWLSEVEAS